MLADSELRRAFLEREHLHELLAKNTWIFGEEFGLTASDESLTTAVRRHVELAGLDVAVDEPVTQSDGRTGRLDLMLTRALGAPAHSREHLVVELKRPTVIDGEAIISQIKKYARALAKDPRWSNTNTRWTFWAVTYEMDEFADAEASQPDRPLGRIEQGQNYSVWLRSWGQILEDCRARMNFLRQALEVESKRQAGVRHLQQVYPGAMPVIFEREGKLVSAARERAEKGRRRQEGRMPSSPSPGIPPVVARRKGRPKGRSSTRPS